MDDEIKNIDDEEILLRRIPTSENYWNPGDNLPLAKEAYHPRDYDEEGISLSRKKFIDNLNAFCENDRGSTYFVGKLRVEDVRELGIKIEPDPLKNAPGHVIFPELNYEDRYETKQKEWKVKLAHQLTFDITGPHPEELT